MSVHPFPSVTARAGGQPRNGAQVICDDVDEEARADIEFLQRAIDILMRRGMTYEEILTAIGRVASADHRPQVRPRQITPDRP